MVWGILTEAKHANERHEKNLEAIKRYLRDKDVNPDLQMKVESYLNYHLKKECSREEELEQQVLAKLNPTLRRKVNFDANGFFLKQLLFFKNNFS